MGPVRTLRLVAAMAMLFLVSACAFHTEEVDIKYGATQTTAALAGADAVTVAVTMDDQRATNRDRISTKRNGYYIPLAPILSSRDVLEIVRESLETELRAQGYRVGAGGRVLNVALSNFYTEMGFGAHATVSGVASVRSGDGAVLASAPHTGEDRSALIIANLAGIARQHVERALRNFVAAVIDDPTLRAALMGVPAPAATSEVPPAQSGTPDS